MCSGSQVALNPLIHTHTLGYLLTVSLAIIARVHMTRAESVIGNIRRIY